MRDVLGDDPWERQVAIANSLRDNSHTCVPSCHASGKDWTAARCALWFLYSFPPATVITTAPTSRQVENILWREISTAISGAKVPLGGRLTTKSLELAKDWFAIGFTASDYNQDAFQGFHAEHILVVLDEANGINKEIREAISGNLSSGKLVRQLEIGNPTDPASEFARESLSNYTNTMPISVFDTPNFTEFGLVQEDFDDDDTWLDKIDGPMPAPYLVQPEWVAKQVAKYGWEDPFVVARVLGKFPGAGPLALIDRAWIEAAQAATLPDHGKTILACDVARYGDDDTCIGLRKGMRYRELQSYQGFPTDYTADELREAASVHGADEIRVDDDGVGGGVTDNLVRYGSGGAEVIRMIAGGSPLELDREDGDEIGRYGNARAEWHWTFRNAMRRGEVDLDPLDSELEFELAQLRKRDKHDDKGRMLMEKKELYKKRVGRSPNKADTVIMAFAPVVSGFQLF